MANSVVNGLGQTRPHHVLALRGTSENVTLWIQVPILYVKEKKLPSIIWNNLLHLAFLPPSKASIAQER